MPRELPVALTIAGSDSGGGAGIQADLKTFAAFGIHGTSVITSLTAQNTLGVDEIFDIPPRFIKAQFKTIHKDFKINAAKTGMLSNKDIIKMVAENVGDYPIVIDPVMVAESGSELLKKDAVAVMKEKLFPKATILTPNIFEAEALSGIEIKGIEDMKEACKVIARHGCDVIVKGGHLDATDVLYHKNKFYKFKAERFGKGAHGSGCTFAAAIASNLALGNDLISAIEYAKRFITSSIKNAYRPGKGVRVVNQLGEVLDTYERSLVVFELKKTLNKITELELFKELIPEVGINVVYALHNAKSIEDVAGANGRIVRAKSTVKIVGDVEFGASKHVAGVVLSAMKFDPKMRSAINIRYSKEILDACKIQFKISTFSRNKEPENIKTMEWGTEEAIKKSGTVPDMIYDLGAVGKEPMIRILGKDPQDIFEKVKKVLLSMQ
ncbi:MAG: bifunctional hydroxymethylpyrimidine kinase/phosphomethylpyrimidine kinase [Candidatus Hydrothermarchaeales archaeon]